MLNPNSLAPISVINRTRRREELLITYKSKYKIIIIRKSFY